ncbi:hypothetical protein IV102_35670 [bacterium]|nr:hypothetical protein [bacterium]
MKQQLVALLLMAMPALAAPPAKLHLQVHTYEGIDYTCYVANGRVWYEFNGRRLAERPLKPTEIDELEASLRQQRFQDLPRSMIYATIDSRDTITVWTGNKPKVVEATTSYHGQWQSQFKRFQSILQAIRRVAPIPGFQIEKLRSKTT